MTFNLKLLGKGAAPFSPTGRTGLPSLSLSRALLCMGLVLAVLLFPPASAAQERRPEMPRGWYVGLAAGFAQTQDATMDSPVGDGSSTTTATMAFGTAPTLAGSFGYRFNDIIRGQMDILRHWYDIDSLTSGTASMDELTSGDVVMTSYMVGPLIDLPVFGNKNRIRPHLGAALGYGSLAVDLEYTEGGSSGSYSTDNGVLVYQFTLGSELRLTPQLSFDLDYRYLSTTDLDFTVNDIDLQASGFGGHHFLIGLRYTF